MDRFKCRLSATKVVKRSAGSALLRDLNHLKLVVREMRKTTHKLFCENQNWLGENEFERIYNILVGEGVDAIFVHGRTAKRCMRVNLFGMFITMAMSQYI